MSILAGDESISVIEPAALRACAQDRNIFLEFTTGASSAFQPIASVFFDW